MLRKVTLGLILVLGACGTARIIQQTGQGGVIELQGDHGKAMEQAQAQMSAHCGPGNFAITQQGEEAIGTDTYTQAQTQDTEHTSHSGRTTTDTQTQQGVTSTRTATAWRVHYACSAAAGAPPVGAPPAAPPPGDPNAGAPPPAPGY